MKILGALFKRCAGVMLLAGVLFALNPGLLPALPPSQSPSGVEVSVNGTGQRIDLKAVQATRRELIAALAEAFPVHWIGRIPRSGERLTLQVSAMSLDGILRRVLAADSFLLFQTESAGRPAWELRFLDREDEAEPPLAPEFLAGLMQLGGGHRAEEGPGPVLEDMVFNGEEAQVYRMLSRAEGHPSANVRRGARMLLEDLGPAWEIPL